LQAGPAPDFADAKWVSGHLDRAAVKARYDQADIISEQSHAEFNSSLRPADNWLNCKMIPVGKCCNRMADMPKAMAIANLYT
jgi:hypothetical protein